MKKFLINIAIFFAIVAVVDFSSGKVFHYLQARAGGRTGAEYYVCEKATEDVIIMGSSRASHHYVPEIITEETGMSCFNAGQDGNGIILQYGRWKMLSERYNPKLVIYDITPSFDLETNDNMTYVDRLKPFCSNEDVNNFIISLFPIERIKLLSNMYRYNYKFMEMALDYKRGVTNHVKSGYIPLYGNIREEIVNMHISEKKSSIVYDDTKLYYIEKLIKEALSKGTSVIFVVSPYWKGGFYESVAYQRVKDIASKYKIPFYMYLDSDISNNPQLFEDSSHLNDKGARSFTTEIVSNIQYEVRK